MNGLRLLRHRLGGLLAPDRAIREKYHHFKELLAADGRALDRVADLEAHLYGHDPADPARIRYLAGELTGAVREMAIALTAMNPARYQTLPLTCDRLTAEMAPLLAEPPLSTQPPYILPLAEAADHPSQTGGKAANLSTALRLGAPVPSGFVITASAFARYLADNRLEAEIERLFQPVSLANHEAIIRATGEMQELILGGEVPAEIAAGILTALANLPCSGPWAVRSSALAEDGTISFAGQYASDLDVPSEDILIAYKRVLAGKYCPRAVAYRLRQGLSDKDTAMAVLILPMIEAEAAGVVYTRDPACSAASRQAMGVYVVKGLGARLVDGSNTPGKYCLSRETEPRVLPGCACENTAPLPDRVLAELGRWSLALEETFGLPQDVEWAYGPKGVTILQTRRLQQDRDQEVFSAEETKAATVLVSGLDCAAPGAACGPVYHASLGSDFQRIPEGSVVVTTSLRPALSQFLSRIVAIVAESGSRASHLASVAREQGVPVVVGPIGALRSGEVVTVDAAAGRIFAGCLPSIVGRNIAADTSRAVIRAGLEELARCTVQLNLVNPRDSRFSPEGCRSFHDLIRFCHEKSVEEMFSLVGRSDRGLGRARPLVTDLPLVMYVLDLGGGLRPEAGTAGEVRTGDIAGVALKSFWTGLTDERITWDRSQLHVDWEQFDRMSGGLFSLDSRILASYALVSGDYLHLNIRFGYHFSIVDALCGETAGANYIRFRFKGGGAAMEQRGYRLIFLERILTDHGFETEIRGDMFDGVYARMPAAETARALQLLGLVLAETRLQDMRLADNTQAVEEATAFIRRFAGEIKQ